MEQVLVFAVLHLSLTQLSLSLMEQFDGAGACVCCPLRLLRSAILCRCWRWRLRAQLSGHLIQRAHKYGRADIVNNDAIDFTHHPQCTTQSPLYSFSLTCW